MAIPVIIDTDPGIDDALAIMLAAASPEIEVIGITSVGGNTGIDNTTRNAVRLAHLLGLDVPVARGAAAPLVNFDTLPAEDIHGATGLGGVELPESPTSEDPRPAVEVLRDLIESSEQPVTVVPIGPLTNIAMLANLHPATYAKIGRIVLMGGGARTFANCTPAAEFNIWFDPEAAERVFASGVDITMVGLDVTHKAMFDPEHWDALRGGGRIAQMVLTMVSFYEDSYERRYGVRRTGQHDSLAVAAVIDPSLFETFHCWVGIETAGRITRGMTVCDLKGFSKKAPNVHVALDVDVERMRKVLVDRLVELDARLG